MDISARKSAKLDFEAIFVQRLSTSKFSSPSCASTNQRTPTSKRSNCLKAPTNWSVFIAWEVAIRELFGQLKRAEFPVNSPTYAMNLLRLRARVSAQE